MRCSRDQATRPWHRLTPVAQPVLGPHQIRLVETAARGPRETEAPRSLSLTRGRACATLPIRDFVRMHMMRKETFQGLARMAVTQQRPSRPHALTPSRVTFELSHHRTDRSTRSRPGDSVRTTRRRHCRPIRSVAARPPAWRPDACPDARPAVGVCTQWKEMRRELLTKFEQCGAARSRAACGRLGTPGSAVLAVPVTCDCAGTPREWARGRQ